MMTKSRKNLGPKPLVFPMVVFIIGTYDEDGNPNAMNAAWGGVGNDEEIFICLSANHKTCKNFEKTGAFTVGIATKDTVISSDYIGLVSANNDKDKFMKSGFTATKSEFVNAPLINELPLVLECEVTSWEPEKCHLFGKIVNVSADESILDDKGKVDVDKLKPISYEGSGHTYRILGDVVGHAFHDGLALN